MLKKFLILILFIFFASGCDVKYNPQKDKIVNLDKKPKYVVIKKSSSLLSLSEASHLRIEKAKSGLHVTPCLIFNNQQSLENWKKDYRQHKSASESLLLNAKITKDAIDKFLLAYLDKTVNNAISKNINLCNIHYNPQINTWKVETDSQILFFTNYQDRLNKLVLDINKLHLLKNDTVRNPNEVKQYCGPKAKNDEEFIWLCGKNKKIEVHVNRRTGEMIAIQLK